ncbi:MAG TPA: 3-dehydroquinate synthase [Gemmatimonadales bacterium]|nr:3-dehydroquinate synthase [Gemmatimonadales bacterium]
MVALDPVIVSHALGSYPVYIEARSLGRLDEAVREHLSGRRIAMIADAAVYGLYQAGRLGAAPWKGDTLTFESGERSKTRESWARLTDALMELGFGRDSGIIALGGGVTGDLAGFVAATYMRGLPCLQVPTTLLAMLDASVGGKTGVDTPRGKNLVGAFHQPVAVLADPQTLATLPEREYRAGLAEAVKHGLIADSEYFGWMEGNTAALIARDLQALVRLIRRSVEIKADVVAGDERESGRRAILNAGHTVAHALEQVSSYEIPHGEAVALGLVAECELAEQLGIAPGGLRKRVAGLFTRLGLPGRLPQGLEPSEVLAAMAADKKNRGIQVHFALPTRLGEMGGDHGWTIPVPTEAIRAALAVIE